MTARVVASSGKPVRLASGPVRVVLKSNGGKTLASQVGSLVRGRRLFLVIGGLHADRQPGIAFDVYLDLPSGTAAAQRLRHYAGSINYYDAVIGHRGQPDAIFSFDITDVARALRGRGLLTDATTLTITPSGGVPAGMPAVDRIEIVEQ